MNYYISCGIGALLGGAAFENIYSIVAGAVLVLAGAVIEHGKRGEE